MSTWPFINPDAILEMESAGRSELIGGSYRVGFIALPARLQDEPEAREQCFGAKRERRELMKLATPFLGAVSLLEGSDGAVVDRG